MIQQEEDTSVETTDATRRNVYRSSVDSTSVALSDDREGEWAMALNAGPGTDIATELTDDNTERITDVIPMDEIEEGEGESQQLATINESNETELVVLDPDHPLMVRFQVALKTHLLKQREKFELELREIDADLKSKTTERENVGVQLYGVQQELAKQQVALESIFDEFTETNKGREKEEQQLGEVRNLYTDIQKATNEEKKRGADVLAEVENLALRLFYMSSAKGDINADIAIMKRAAEKAESDVSKSEVTKQKQDLYVNRLVERVDKLKEEIAMFDAQQHAQTDELKAARDALMEAHMEMEAINIERRQLFQQWNSSLIGMRRRDEAHAAMQEALRQQLMKVQTLKMEIDGVKKSTLAEQETNEKLTLILNKTESDLAMTRKLLGICVTKHEALKAEYATYTRMLFETEQALSRANAEKNSLEANKKSLQKQVEIEYNKKKDLEDAIMEKMRTQLILDKSAQYSEKLTKKTRELTTALEHQLTDEENKESMDDLHILNMKTKLESLDDVKATMEDEISTKNGLVTNSTIDIKHRMALVERKQTLIDQYNKRIEALINAAGGVEIGPLEMTINSMLKTLDSQQQEIIQNQQQWLRRQTDLVKVTREKMEQWAGIEGLKKRQMILTQKKLRAEKEVDFEYKEIADLQREVLHMRNDIIKLNTLIFKQSGIQENLERDNILKENDFVYALKDCEQESLTVQEKLDSTKKEKERVLNKLIEAERHIMLWEKKTQLARETKATVDMDVGQGEMRAMKLELHRMQVRYTQLMRHQEKLIQEMEKSISRRDTIVTKGDAQSKMAKNANAITKATFQRQLVETKKKIKQTILNANACDTEIKDLRGRQEELSKELDTKQLRTNHLQSEIDIADHSIEKFVEQKQMNLTKLLGKQQTAKHIQQLKELKYVRVSRSQDNIENEITKQVERARAIHSAVNRLIQEYPNTQPVLRKATLMLKSRLAPPPDDLSSSKDL